MRLLAWISFFCVVLVVPGFSDSNYSCPTWFYFSNKSQRCECGISMQGVNCNQQTMEVEIWFDYCATYSGQEGLFFAGYCPYSYKFNHSHKLYSLLPTDPDLLGDKMCGPYNRKGTLCGECIDGYGPGVYTLDRRCVDCSKLSLSSAICLYLVVEFVPVLLLFFYITIFRLDLTSGPMLGYVLFCQMFSSSFKALAARPYDVIQSHVPGYIGSISLVIIEFWNLNFFKSVIPPFCISDKLTELHIILLNSVAALYPVLIAITTLIVIDLHSKEYKVVLILFKPLGFVVKISNSKAITSDAVIHTFASFFLLSSTKTFFVFITLLQSIPMTSSTSGSVYKNVLYHDASIEYFSHEHILYLLLALTQCLFLVLLPSLLLFLYPTRLYRWISQFISARKQLAITTFVEALNHCFKDGLNGTGDYRALAGFFTFGVPLCCLVSWILSHTSVHINLLFLSYLLLQFSYCQPFKSAIANLSGSVNFFIFEAGTLTYYFWRLRATSLWQIATFLLPLSQVPVFLWMLYNLVCYIQKIVSGRRK